MEEKNLNFDKVIDRRNTNSLKYDFAKKRGMPEDVLPLWVADMDFKISSCIQEALTARVEHGIFGYSEAKEEYFYLLQKWMKEHYGWNTDKKWLVKTAGIVFALATAIKAFTNVNDGVLIQVPVYYPFYEVIEDNKRRVIKNTLQLGDDNKYHIDFDDFEKKIKDEKIKLFILCNPHNPVGRVWNRAELERLGDICYKHNVIVISDEIHADYVFEGKHNVFANLKKEFADITITCTSPSKTFNIAGLQVSNIFIPNSKIRRLFRGKVFAAGYSQLNTMGLIACESAYQYGEAWYKEVHEYIRKNIEFTNTFINKNIPKVKMVKHEGTYLVWIDFRELRLSQEELDDLIINKAKLWLDSGTIFGESGNGFQRINVACPRIILEEALKRIKEVI